MSTLSFLIVGGGIATMFLAPQMPLKELAVDVTVIDEQKLPVEGAKVQTGYRHFIGRTRFAFMLASIEKRHRDYWTVAMRDTNAKGVSKLRFNPDSASVNINITKDGYYLSHFTLPSRMPETPVRWTKKPQKITARLRPIKNPIPLIYMDMRDSPAPFDLVSGDSLGFDLLLSKWMPPHGQGKQADVMISIKSDLNLYKKEFQEQSYARKTFEFIGEGNGINAVGKDQFIKESRFPYVYEASQDGYELKTFTQISYFPQKHELNLPLANFTFRIRTEFDEEGNIKSAFYGQFSGEIDRRTGGVDKITTQGGGRKGGLALLCTYWLNPTPNERNLEPARTERGLQTGVGGFIPYEGPIPNHNL